MKKNLTKAQQLLAVAGKAAADTFKKCGELMPILHMVDEFDNHIPIHWATGFENYESKDATIEIMRKAIKEANAQRYALVMEAWSALPRDGAHAMAWKERTGKSLEEYPDRIEMIAIFVEDKNTGECLTRHYRILRPEHGPATLAPPWDGGGNKEDFSGRFMHLFEEGE